MSMFTISNGNVERSRTKKLFSTSKAKIDSPRKRPMSQKELKRKDTDVVTVIANALLSYR